MKSVFKNTWPYQDDEMNLPVENVDQAIPFYETVMGFQVVSRCESPQNFKVFFVVAPDGLCYCLGEPQQ